MSGVSARRCESSPPEFRLPWQRWLTASVRNPGRCAWTGTTPRHQARSVARLFEVIDVGAAATSAQTSAVTVAASPRGDGPEIGSGACLASELRGANYEQH